jgi:hypothetical protein
MSTQPRVKPPSSATSISSKDSPNGLDNKQPLKEPATVTGLASTETRRMDAALGDYILRLLRIRKGPKNDVYDLDAVSRLPQDER